MDPTARLLWGLAVWLAISSLCLGASFKGQFYFENGVSHDSSPQTPTFPSQDTSSAKLQQAKDDQVKIIGALILPENLSDTEPGVDVEHSLTPGEAVAPDNPPSTNAKTDNLQLPIPRLTGEEIEEEHVHSEEEIEEEDELSAEEIKEEYENGLIRGKFSYVEEDGVPAQIEYEAIPGLKFEVKSYMKGLKVLPPPVFDESPEIGRENPIECIKSIEEGDIGTKINNANFKSTSTVALESEPEYEHASVIGRYDSKANERKTRSTNNQYKKSEEGLINESHDENSKTKEDDIESAIDASYRFGFSADGQTRQEEADAQGNVQGSYSYIGEDGIMTRVEYEAGSGKGFIVKRVTHEDTRKSLQAQPEKSQTELDQSSNIEAEKQLPNLPVDEYMSEDHKKQETQNASPIEINRKHNHGEGIENEDETKVNHSGDKSYSLYYAVPDQWIPASKNVKGNILQVNADGSYSYSYMIPDQYHVEAAQVKKLHFSPKDTRIAQEEREESSKVEDITSQKVQDNTFIDKSSPQIKNDGSYSYSYETDDQTRYETGDVGGNVQGKYSFISDDGIRRTVHYKANPASGFKAEGSHLPGIQNKSEGTDALNVEKGYKSVASPDASSSHEKFPTNTISYKEKLSTVEHVPSVDKKVNLNTDSDNQYTLYGIKTYSTQVSHGPQGFDYPTQEFPVLQEKGAFATEDGHIHKYKKVIKKRPIQATLTSENTPSDAAYSFEYELEDQKRKELADTKGNVYSTYQFNTKDGGRTNFFYVRKTEGDKENTGTGVAAKRHIPVDYINEEKSFLDSNIRPTGRNWNSRKRQAQGLPEPNINRYTLSDRDIQVNSDRRVPSQDNYIYQNRQEILQPPRLQESAEFINHRSAKSITKPFRGYVKYH